MCRLRKLAANITAFVLIIVILTACAGSQGVTSKTEEALERIAAIGAPTEDLYRTFYEIFVYSFCDSNGDGIGDLKGVESKLDYLQMLGIEGIWLMPISPSPSYHKYDVTDYMAIDEQYGTMEDFDSLLKACHERNIKLILDLVVNHSSSEHPWFVTAVDYLRNLPEGEAIDILDCPTADYYVFNKTGGGGYNQIEGSEWYYECGFSESMPDLNWDSRTVYTEMESVMRFWLEKGVDGFRLDAAKHYYTDQTEKNIRVLEFLQNTAEKYNPKAYLVAEVWDSSSVIGKYYASGINSIFDFPYANHTGHIIKTLRGLGNTAIATEYINKIQAVEKTYKENNPDYIGAPFLSNHDTGRIANFLGGDEALIKMAGAMNLFMYGSAFIYYGEEIGMRQGATNDPSYRAPMYWSNTNKEGMTEAPPGCTLPEEYFFGSMEEQLTQDDSVLNYYRQAIAIRKHLPAIARGTDAVEEELNKDSIAAQRKTWESKEGLQECIILYNISDEATEINMEQYKDWRFLFSLDAVDEAAELVDNTLYLPAYGIAILSPN